MAELPRLVKASRKLPDTFTDDELVIVGANAQGWLATAIQLSAQAGLRMGEVLAIQVADISFDQEILLVKRALSGGEVLTQRRSRAHPPHCAPLSKARPRTGLRRTSRCSKMRLVESNREGGLQRLPIWPQPWQTAMSLMVPDSPAKR